MITTWNSRCGIASYSEHLIEYISDHVSVFAPFEDTIVQDGSNIHRCWDIDNQINQDFTSLFQEISQKKISTVVIQFNYGFFDFKKFSHFLRKLSLHKKNIILFYKTIYIFVETNN